MDVRDLINETVIHKLYGKGKIDHAYDNYLEIDFAQCNKKSKFSYPMCFDGFLSLENDEKEREAIEDLKQWKINSGADQSEKLWQQCEKTQQGIAERRIAAAEKKQRHAQKSMELRSERFKK